MALSILESLKCAALQWWDLDGLPAEIPAYERIVLDGIARNDLAAFTSFGLPERGLVAAHEHEVD